MTEREEGTAAAIPSSPGSARLKRRACCSSPSMQPGRAVLKTVSLLCELQEIPDLVADLSTRLLLWLKSLPQRTFGLSNVPPLSPEAPPAPEPQRLLCRTNLLDSAPIQCVAGFQVSLTPTMGGDPWNKLPYTHL